MNSIFKHYNDINDVCNYVLLYEEKQGRTVTVSRLQKLLYFVQAAYCGNNQDLCFTEPIEAWDTGAVVVSMYNKYLFYAMLSITPPRGISMEQIEPSLYMPELIRNTLDACADKNNIVLGNILRSQSPYQNAITSGARTEISKEQMIEYYW